MRCNGQAEGILCDCVHTIIDWNLGRWLYYNFIQSVVVRVYDYIVPLSPSHTIEYQMLHTHRSQPPHKVSRPITILEIMQ